MKAAVRTIAIIVVAAMFCATIGFIVMLRRPVRAAADQYVQWSDPENPSDQLVTGPYRVDPNWPKLPGPKGWTFGSTQAVFVQNPDRIFVGMRGELPDLTHVKPTVADLET